MARKKPETKQTLTVNKRVEVELPPDPVLKSGEIGYRMVYDDGRVRDIIAKDMPECIDKAMAQSKQDGINFQQSREVPGHVAYWEPIERSA